MCGFVDLFHVCRVVSCVGKITLDLCICNIAKGRKREMKRAYGNGREASST